MTFEQYIINKYPLYAKVDFESINVSWGEVFKSYNEYLAEHQPIVTVEMHEPNAILIGEPFRNTQDNHLKTNG